jgi:hypothetical protein
MADHISSMRNRWPLPQRVGTGLHDVSKKLAASPLRVKGASPDRRLQQAPKTSVAGSRSGDAVW